MIMCLVTDCISWYKGYCDKQGIKIDENGYCKSFESAEKVMKKTISPTNITHTSHGYRQNRNKTFK